MRMSRPAKVAACASILIGAILSWSSPPSAAAGGRTFPYDAVVRSEEVEVRSGPGQRYYVTGRLHRNDRITVHRHDPGGWYMIAPPAGSFSWIEAAVVRRTGGSIGVVELPSTAGTPPRAIVRIGSEFSNEHSFSGRELAHGDEVHILGEQTLNTDRGAVHMYKIAPPPFEYRWVKGDFIVPVSEAASAPTAPAEFPLTVGSSFPRASAPRDEPGLLAGPSAAVPATSRRSTSPPASGDSRDAHRSSTKERLMQLDERFLSLSRKPIEDWDLDTLSADYRRLREVADASQAASIDQRLEALERRRQVWEEYQAFVRLTTETEQRDAALRAAQQGGVAPAGGVVPAGGIPGGVVPAGGVIPAGGVLPAGGVVPLGGVWSPESGVTPAAAQKESLAPVPGTSTATPLHTPAPVEAGPPAEGVSLPPLSGAGLVQRLPQPVGGGFTHALVDPRGKVLAVLHAGPGTNLEAHVGRSVGVVGPRGFDPRLRTDVIQVHRLVPVQLAP